MFYLCLLFLQLTLVVSEISWENCHSNSNTIKLLNLTVTPYPIVTPGSLTAEITIHNDQPISSPLKVQLSLYKKMLFGSLHVPCVSGIGSCKYDDLCTLCPQCGCPLKTGDHNIALPITIDVTSWAFLGNYQAQIDIETTSGDKGCVTVNNIHIKSHE